MVDGALPETLTPRAERLALVSTGADSEERSVPRGEPLTVITRLSDDDVEVEYRGRRWRAPKEALQRWEPSAGEPSTNPSPPPTRRRRSAWRETWTIGRPLVFGSLALALLLLVTTTGAWRGVVRSSPSDQTPVPPAVEKAPVNTAQPEPTPAATRVASTPASPQIVQLAICDGRTDCGGEDFTNRRDRLTACLTLVPSADGRPVTLIATDGDQPPVSANDRSVVARSGPVEQRATFTCHVLDVTRQDVAPGEYWLWVLPTTAAAATPAPPAATASPAPTASPRPVVASPTSQPAATVSAAAPPRVTQLSICDGTIDCGGDDLSRQRDSLTACLTVTAGADDRPVTLVATERDRPPATADDGSVLGRSSAVAQRGSFTCQTIRFARGGLSSGEYWLWVLAGENVLARESFRIR